MQSNTMWLYILVVNLVSTFGAKLLEECVISPNGDLPDQQPLLLKPSPSLEMMYPNTKLAKRLWGGVKMYKGDQFELACPGTGFSGDKVETITATCVKGTTVSVDNQKYNVKQLNCAKTPQAVARWTDIPCADNKHNLIEIGHMIEKEFLPVLYVCFDNDQKIALYSSHVEVPSIYAYQRSYERVDFEAGQFYKDVIKSVNKLYTVNKQRQRISDILGSTALGDKYIGGISDGHYLARGHLTAKADFVFGVQQSATFFFVNVVPQWQIFNAGNWATLEENVRTFVANFGKPVVVYTGTHGVATLPDVEGVEQELYLSSDNNNNNLLPVPKLMWKLLYSEETSAGVVFVGVNNPYITDVNGYLICKDICGQISWLTWDQKNIQKGYGYCCEVSDFLKTVKTLPSEIIVSSLLK